jgi:glycosyltransferase involved in cell wall biosynthesis
MVSRRVRGRRRELAWWEVPAHRLALRGVRLRRRTARTKPAKPKVTFLLMHAWGMGGTIRTTLNLAAHLAERHDVEILSVVRRRDRPFFPFPADVAVTAVDDQRGAHGPGIRRRLERLLRARRSLLLHPADHASDSCSLWTDLLLLRRLRCIGHGAIVGSRPALNVVAAAAARPGLAAIGQEHMNLGAHPSRLRAAMRRGYAGLDAVVVLSEPDVRDYRGMLRASTRVLAIPNAIPAIEGPAAPLTAPTILAAGRLTRQKGFDRLIPAFAPVARRHPDWTLRICGRGPAAPRLRRLVAEHELSDRVLLLGAVKDLAREMAQASLFVLSSRFEGLPMVLLEAMRAGLPVASFDCPTGPREVVEHERTGLLVDEGDEAALAAAMLRLVEDEDARRRMGAAGRARARAFTMEAVGPRWEALLHQLLAREPRTDRRRR